MSKNKVRARMQKVVDSEGYGSKSMPDDVAEKLSKRYLFIRKGAVSTLSPRKTDDVEGSVQVIKVLAVSPYDDAFNKVTAVVHFRRDPRWQTTEREFLIRR